MAETCGYCGALFTVSCIGGGMVGGACLEPINCPHCKALIGEERTSGTFIETLVKAPDSALAQYLGITDAEWNDMGADLHANTGHSDDTVYSYWFTVPEGMSEDLLEKTGWKVGQTIGDIPVWAVEAEEPDMAASN